jgi:NAD(P)-dependent dehydrogenase (short-subunit alcohol dehydrogenase family)
VSVSSLFSLEGRVALVTGASSGLGVTFARALADAGADVVLAARRVDRLEEVAEAIRKDGRRALAVECDVTDPDMVEAAVGRAVAEFGRIDVLVANAGSVPEGFAMPEKLPAELFAQSIDVNLNGTWNTCQSVGRQMLRQGAGSIVIISSYTGLAGVPHFPPAYQAAKAALINISKSLAVSWGDRGIRVNALAPGWFPSEMTDLVLAAPPFLARVNDQAPLGRPGRPEELVGALLLLASDAGSYMTGSTITVDGGTSASVGLTPYSEELFGLHAAVMPAGLGERITPEPAA